MIHDFLLISDEYPPFHGGIARVCGNIVDQLRCRGHRVTVFTDGSRCKQLPPQNADDLTIKLHHLPKGRQARRLHRYFQVPITLSKLIRRKKFAKIVVADPAFSPIMPLVRSWTRCDYTMLLYGSELLSNSSRPLAKWMYRRAASDASQLFSITKYVDQVLRRCFSLRSDIAYLGVEEQFLDASVDETLVAKLRTRYGFSTDDVVVGTISRLDYRKGNDVVIEAMALLADQFPRLRYFIGGVGEEQENLVRLVASRHLQDRVVFGGRVEESELVAHYDFFDLYAMPNRVVPGFSVEGFGLVFVEAAARGIPSIGVNNGGVGEAIDDGVSGQLLDQAEPDAVAAAIESILTGQTTFCKDAMREHTRQFSWRRCVDQIFFQ
jgi:glycosyltransferase involved in cell wall biosynthesis